MKTGRTLVALANELERQAIAKRDYIADTGRLRLVTAYEKGQGFPAYLRAYDVNSGVDFEMPIEPLAHRQIGGRLKIPARYYDRMLEEAPQLLARNVNHWFEHSTEDRMIRTLDNRVRAFLSDRYRRLDNADMMIQAIMPALEANPDLKIESCQITDQHLYIKATTPRLQAEVKKGDVVQAGIVISNSEVGMGKLRVEPLILRLVCENGMIAADRTGYGLKKYHIGRRLGSGEEAAAELFSDEAMQADDRAFWLMARDTIKGALDQAIFAQIVGTMRDSTERRITGDPVAAVRELANRYRLTEPEEVGIRTQLIQNETLTQYGLLNAVTRYSQEVSNYDRATELERLGGEIITLAPGEWKPIAEAA